MRVRINVTQQDIDKSKRNRQRSGYCPIDYAAKRALTAASGLATLHVNTGVTEMQINTNPITATDEEYVSGVFWVPLPAKARKFIRDFDDFKPVKPISFMLEV